MSVSPQGKHGKVIEDHEKRMLEDPTIMQ